LLAKNQNLSNQLDSLKDTNSRLIDYVKSINKKVETAYSGKEFSEITENNKSRKIKEHKSKTETALWFVESYGLVPQYLKLESADGQTVLKSISIRRPANLHTKICLKKKDNKLKICYLF
jgi:hypothetical protein